MFTIKDLIRTIRELAAEKPNYIYASGESRPDSGSPACFYGKENCECIFGQAFKLLGVSVDVLRKFDVSYIPIRWILSNYSRHIGLEGSVDANELLWCGWIQRNQDAKMPWGQCVLFSDQKYPLQPVLV